MGFTRVIQAMWKLVKNSKRIFQKFRVQFFGHNSFVAIFCEETNMHGFIHVANNNYYHFERCEFNIFV